jgi:hypothetical protein
MEADSISVLVSFEILYTVSGRYRMVSSFLKAVSRIRRVGASSPKIYNLPSLCSMADAEGKSVSRVEERSSS